VASVLGIVVVASFSVEGGQPDCGYSIECCVQVLCFFMLLCSLFIEQFNKKDRVYHFNAETGGNPPN
jgi:hypothetical protein